MIKRIGNHAVSCNSVENVNFSELLNGKKARIFYSDPPWGDGNAKYWATINKRHTGQVVEPLKYKEIIEIIKKTIVENVDGYIFIETGNRWLEETLEIIKPVVHNIKIHNLVYKSGSKMLPNPLISCSTSRDLVFPACLDGMSGLDVPKAAIQSVAKPDEIVLDPFCGMGYTAQAAIDNGMLFAGNELNAKRLQKTIAKLV
jgi:hypothetical protein